MERAQGDEGKMKQNQASQQPSDSATEPTTMEGLEALREDHKRLLEQAEAEGVETEARAIIDSLNHLVTKRQLKGDALRTRGTARESRANLGNLGGMQWRDFGVIACL